ncbi:hypothetical protein BZM27_34795 [Paraburkholderia steynii]|uniref:Uncharacterized protein n=1 Tax=Paraburkholderia steynii TaxID=1245441 RepID=A0A4R0X8N1_9BURK|nr:hypothetical protein BZM27_34795 [Paraburkholderia steynii]
MIDKASKKPVAATRYKAAFIVELSRAASYISSTLTPASMFVAVKEVVDGFIAERGPLHVHEFCLLLEESLAERLCFQAADIVRAYCRSIARRDRLRPRSGRKLL